MEENQSLTSTVENSPCIDNVKSFVHNFEQSNQNCPEKEGHSDSCKKRETMKQTSFKKLQDLKKNFEQSMHQRYQSNKNIKKIGKPISELKEALKKSMENISSASFSVKLRNKGSSDNLNKSSTTSPSSKSRRFSLGSPKFKAIPLPIPKAKTSYNNKKYKSISDLTRESVIVEDIEFNKINNDFEHSRLSYNCSTPLKHSRHSESLSESSHYSSQHSEVFNESPDISMRNSILSHDYMSSTFPPSPKLFSNQSPKLCPINCLMFEPIGETSTDDLEDDNDDLEDDQNNLIVNENIKQTTTNELSIDLISDTNALEYEYTNNEETLHSSMNFHVDINTSESSDNDDDAIENGSYYISQEEFPNEYEADIIESHFPAETNSALSTAEINLEVDKNLKSFSLESPWGLPQSTSSPDDCHITSSLNVEQPPPLTNSTDNSSHNQAIRKLSIKKPCLKVSPLQNNQASASQQNINAEGTSFESTKHVSPTINASPILNQPLCCSINNYFQTILTSLQTIEQSDIFDVDIITNLFTKPLSVFDRVSDVFCIHNQSSNQSPNQPIQHPITQTSTNEKLIELGEDLISQVDVLMTDNKTQMEAQNKHFSQLKEMLCESMEDERKREGCMRKMKELLKQVDSVTCLLLLLNQMISRKQYCNLKEIHKTEPGEAVEIKLRDAKELKGTLDEKYYSMFSYLSTHSNQQTCDFFMHTIQNNLRLKFEKEYLSHKSFQLQRLLSLFKFSFDS